MEVPANDSNNIDESPVKADPLIYERETITPVTAEPSYDNSPTNTTETVELTEEDISATSTIEESHELFVGDLSFFCREEHLLDLFSTFGTIVDARVRRSDNKGHSLMYGFVKMENLSDAERAAEALNDRLYMGRSLR